MISKLSIFLLLYARLINLSAFTHMQQLQRTKEPLSLVVGMVLRSLQLLVTITRDGADWMTCNQLDVTIEQSLTAIKFM